MSKGWDSGMLKKLKSLVGKGLSTAEMGKKLGMSKNAVVGKLNRLGWNAKAAEVVDKKSAKTAKASKVAKPAKKETKNTKAPAKKTAAKKAVVAKKPVKPVKVAKTTKKPAKKAPVAPKKAPVKKAVKVVVKKETKKPAKPVVKETVKKAGKQKDVAPAKEKPVIKTASKKTKRDLALHELLIQHALQMANLKPNQCRWPIGDPDSDNFHFCGETVFTGKPYCYEHCRQAYQFVAPKKK